ncbi:MAG TPA: PPOX class F420-dependent oxidoreductase [Chloroflexota bacterium]|nr:PPOX class F420-dependent oxidoreductase [Chloroflexota bacterium]
MTADPLNRFRSEKYLSLVTFRRDGRAVATPVWFVLDGTRLLVWTGAATGKAKRIRNNPQVSVTPCSVRGALKGELVPAVARLLPQSDGPRVQALLNRKYGVVKRLLDGANAISRIIRRRQPTAAAYLEITLTWRE